MSADREAVRRVTAMVGRVLAVVGAFAVVAAGFLPWTDRAGLALDLGAFTWKAGAQPTVTLVLVALAALPALAALAVGWAWPRVVAAVGVAALALSWLATGPDAGLTSGVWTALGGAATLLVAAGLTPPRRRDPLRRRRPAAPRTHAPA